MKKARNLWRVGYLVCILTIVGKVIGVAAIESATYYVATTGSDSNPGSLSQPFRTIQKAANLVNAGDTVLVRAGRYPAFTVVSKNGSSTAPITFASYPNEQATVDCYLGGTTQYVRVEITDSSYLVFDNLEITTTDPLFDTLRALNLNNSNDVATAQRYSDSQNFQQKQGSCGFVFNSPSPPAPPVHHITFKNIKAHHVFYQPFAGRADDVQIINSEIYDNGYPFGGYGCYCIGARWLIQGNTIHNNTYGLHLYNDSRTVSLTDAVIERNLFYSNGGLFIHSTSGLGAGQNMIIMPGNNVILRNNVFADTVTGVALSLWSNTNTKVYNNTFYKNPNGAIFLASSASSTIVKNNIFYQNGMNIEGGTLDSSNLQGNPSFANVATRNYTLRSGSPAIDKGVTLSDVPYDFNGTTRPQGAGYDIGAFEYPQQTATTSPPSPPSNLRVGSGN